MVTNLPPNTTSKELVRHFSNLYQLDSPDWRKRPPLLDAQPVNDIATTGKDIYLNSWIAEATVLRQYGNAIRAFKNEEALAIQLSRARAFIKMYKTDTTHSDGPNMEKMKVWTEKLRRYEVSIDEVTDSVFAWRRTTRRVSFTAKKNPTTQVAYEARHKRTLSETVGADAVAAFIVFNYTESKARCLEDFRTFSGFPGRLFYPERLKLRGKVLSVKVAQEPDELIFENIEISRSWKLLYRLRTFLVSLAFLIAGFAIILQAAVYQNSFKGQVPDFALCQLEIPALYVGSYNIPSNPSMTRPSTTKDKYGLTQSDYDAKCSAAVPGSFYLVSAVNGDISRPIGAYNISACILKKSSAALDKKHGQCPHFNQTVFCPCLKTDAAESCGTLACSYPSSVASAGRCSSFASKTIPGCFCYNNMLQVFRTVATSGTSSLSGPCYSFFVSYVSAMGFQYIAAFLTIVTNFCLKIYVTYSTKSEYWNSFASENAYVLLKIFFVLYVNMAVIVLLAYGYLERSNSALQQVGLLNGSYLDFDPSWFGQVGTLIVITYLANAFEPYIKRLIGSVFAWLFWSWGEVSKVAARKSHTIATQYDLNELLAGSVYSPTSHMAQLLTMLFLGMTYAPGIPVFMPLLSLTFFVYFNIDKYLTIRVWRRPPYRGDQENKIILALLPFAAIVRLAIACWMYGNNEIFPSTVASTAFIPDGNVRTAAEAEQSYQAYLDSHQGDNSYSFLIASKIGRANVFPLFFLLMVIVSLMVLRRIFPYLPTTYFFRIVKSLFQFIRTLGHANIRRLARADGYIHGQDLAELKDPLRPEMAPFTGSYFKYLRPVQSRFRFSLFACLFGRRPDLTEEEKSDGWTLQNREEYIIKVKIDTLMGDAPRETKTFELINSKTCCTYSIERVPAYVPAMKALKKGLGIEVASDSQNDVTNDQREVHAEL